MIKNSSESPFGVLEFLHWNHSWNSYKFKDEEELEKVIGLMKEAGVGWVRMDFLWEDIEPEQGKFNLDKYDKIVNLLCKNNVNVLGLFNYGASWASFSGEWNIPPSSNILFVKYAVKVSEHFKDRVKYWEVWNEPDSQIYWKHQDGLKAYSLLLRDVFQALKRTDPNCKILNGGFAKGVSSVEDIYANGAGNYFDILNLHIFESPLNPGAIKRVVGYLELARKAMVINGDGLKKIWITEIGCPGVKMGCEAKPWWMGKNPTLYQQAEWVKEAYIELLKLAYVEKVFWAFFRDCNEHWNNGVDYLGLIGWDYSKKPSFSVYKECAEKWNKQNNKGE